jgi:hypothetical protein
MELIEWKERGAGGRNRRFEIANNTMCAHLSEFPVGTYKKGHRHGPGAHVIIVKGKGYTLMWPEGSPKQRFDWQEGSIIVPPDKWFHQHFNAGPTPARYLAFKYASPRNSQGVPMSWISKRMGGNQIDYADEKPMVRQMFADALARHGLTPRMDDAYQSELASLPPKVA